MVFNAAHTVKNIRQPKMCIVGVHGNSYGDYNQAYSDYFVHRLFVRKKGRYVTGHSESIGNGNRVVSTREGGIRKRCEAG